MAGMELKDSAIVIAALLALFGSVWNFVQQRRQANREPFLRKQFELCFEASDTASRLATETDPVEWEKARHSFWRLYWGTLSIVESADVAGAMIEVGRLVPYEPISNPTLPMRSLERSSYHVALAMRSLILKSWGVPFTDLPSFEAKEKRK
jgi:hypothetical protein